MKRPASGGSYCCYAHAGMASHYWPLKQSTFPSIVAT